MESQNSEFIKSFIPEKAFKIFGNYVAESLSNEKLDSLHSYFGNTLIEATELFEHAKIIKYTTSVSLRSIYEINCLEEKYALFENVNFCHCNVFLTEVLQAQKRITCIHVLLLNLARSTAGKIQEMKISDRNFTEYLNYQIQDNNNFHK